MTASAFRDEVSAGRRFEFGKNWQRFLAVLNDDRIAEAERSLREMLGADDLAGKSFLDVGSGSGLFSLAAKRLGAAVRSFDFDTQSVACTNELRRRYYPAAADWTISQGSVLDADFLASLGRHDIVYSWGVLHHTGAMWQAIANVLPMVKNGGSLYISIYNDQGIISRGWLRLKQLYNHYPSLRSPLVLLFTAYWMLGGFVADIAVKRQNPLRRYREYGKTRGMSYFHDVLDWLGGYPFEVAKPEAIIEYVQQRGFAIQRLKTVGGKQGCNEYLFHKV